MDEWQFHVTVSRTELPFIHILVKPPTNDLFTMSQLRVRDVPAVRALGCRWPFWPSSCSRRHRLAAGSRSSARSARTLAGAYILHGLVFASVKPLRAEGRPAVVRNIRGVFRRTYDLLRGFSGAWKAEALLEALRGVQLEAVKNPAQSSGSPAVIQIHEQSVVESGFVANTTAGEGERYGQ